MLNSVFNKNCILFWHLPFLYLLFFYISHPFSMALKLPCTRTRYITGTGNIATFITSTASTSTWLQRRARLTAPGVGRGRLFSREHFSPARRDTVSNKRQKLIRKRSCFLHKTRVWIDLISLPPPSQIVDISIYQQCNLTKGKYYIEGIETSSAVYSTVLTS